jgi:hypothetical protein
MSVQKERAKHHSLLLHFVAQIYYNRIHKSITVSGMCFINYQGRFSIFARGQLLALSENL